MDGQRLPPELLLHIFEQIGDAQALCHLRATAKWLRELIDSQEMSSVWRRLAISHGYAGPHEELIAHKSWKDLYRYAHSGCTWHGTAIEVLTRV